MCCVDRLNPQPFPDPNVRKKRTLLMIAFHAKAEVNAALLKVAALGQMRTLKEYKYDKRYIHIRIKVPNIPSHPTFNRNSGQAGQLFMVVSEF